MVDIQLRFSHQNTAGLRPKPLGPRSVITHQPAASSPSHAAVGHARLSPLWTFPRKSSLLSLLRLYVCMWINGWELLLMMIGLRSSCCGGIKFPLTFVLCWCLMNEANIERAVFLQFFYSHNQNNIHGRLPLEVYLPQHWV